MHPGILLADRDYDSNAIRQDVRDRGDQPGITTRRSRRIQHSVRRPLYALRNRIERCINRLKNHRRVATRYDYTATSFLGSVQLAAIRLWISFVPYLALLWQAAGIWKIAGRSDLV